MIQPVEILEITVLVDNGTDSLSTNPGFVGRRTAAGDEMAERSGRALALTGGRDRRARRRRQTTSLRPA
jgi:hypothetical protein